MSRWSWFALVLGLAATGPALAEPGGAGRGGRPHGPPPPEALQACSGAQAGASCSFQHDGRTITGVCRPGPRGEVVACAPDRPPPPPPEAVEACAQVKEGEACGFTAPDGTKVSGTCRPGPQGQPAACAPAPGRQEPVGHSR